MRVGFEAWGPNFQVNRPLINWEKIGLCHVCHCFHRCLSITIVVCFFVFKGASNDDSIFICIKQHCCCKCTVSVETKNASTSIQIEFVFCNSRLNFLTEDRIGLLSKLFFVCQSVFIFFPFFLNYTLHHIAPKNCIQISIP